jgi:lipoprotein-releasing system ATP-binding protein
LPILAVEHLKKTYWDSNQELKILKDINLELKKGEFACISGQSGCGKSTFLHLLGLLDRPDSGKILLNGESVNPDSPNAASLRNKAIGFIFQFHYLMEDLTTLENVALPLMVAGKNRKDSFRLASDMLNELDIGHRAGHYPHQLSGGEQQRVALGRALINQPAIVLADEPTGNLDPTHSADVLDLLFRFNQKLDSAFILVTHDMSIAARAHTHYRLEDGILLLQI